VTGKERLFHRLQQEMLCCRQWTDEYVRRYYNTGCEYGFVQEKFCPASTHCQLHRVATRLTGCHTVTYLLTYRLRIVWLSYCSLLTLSDCCRVLLAVS